MGKITEMARERLWRYTGMNFNLNKAPKITNRTSTDVTLGCAWYNRMVANQGASHSIAPVDKQIN